MTRSASAVSDEVLRRYSARDREIPFREFVGLIDQSHWFRDVRGNVGREREDGDIATVEE